MMPEELVVRQCAPTLAGIKTGSLFRAAYEDKEQLLGQIREINQRLREKGLCLLPLRFRNGNALLYLYRPERLKTDLNNELARRTLGNAGYTDAEPRALRGGRSSAGCSDEAEFPHEIGLFLSYPPEDVQGFIDHHARELQAAPDSGRFTETRRMRARHLQNIKNVPISTAAAGARARVWNALPWQGENPA